MGIDYKELGITPKERGMIVGCIKRVFSRSNKAIQARQKARSDKTGSRGGARYTCAVCGKSLPANGVQVDHISPVVPLYTTVQSMDISVLLQRLWCDDKNLQVLCKECHLRKSKLERKERKKYASNKQRPRITSGGLYSWIKLRRNPSRVI